MNFPFFISNRLYLQRKRSFTGVIVRIAITAVALSIAVMILTFAVVTAFQNEISNKVFSFWGHIHITNYDTNVSFEPVPVERSQAFLDKITAIKNVKHIQAFTTKAGILKKQSSIEGIVLKGIDHSFDWSFLNSKMIEGTSFTIADSGDTRKMVLSEVIANKLSLKSGEKVIAYFIDDKKRLRPRDFTVTGIYDTGLEEYDNTYCIVGLNHIQRLNGWTENQVGGFEVFVNDLSKLDETNTQIFNTIDIDLFSQTFKEVNPNLFDWLEMQTINKYFILVMMIVVALINMVTVLLILILERTHMIGILKALGSNNWEVQKIFLLSALNIIISGLVLGNILGIGLGLAQQHFNLIQLPEESYYVSSVPIHFDWLTIVLLNVGTVAICLIMLIIPSYIITRISPYKAIRFQ